MSFKTGTVKHGAPSDISSSVYSLLNKLPIQSFYLTLTDFKDISKRPKGKPDYVSYYFDKTGKRNISSEYCHNENGVVRGSNHWGEEISSCSSNKC